MSQFNHMIVYSVINGRNYFFDCADKYLLDFTCPANLAGKKILTVDSDSSMFVDIPKLSERQSLIVYDREIKLDTNNIQNIIETVCFYGYNADFIRSIFLRTLKNKWQETLIRLIENEPGIEFDTIAFNNLYLPENIDSFPVLSIFYRLKNSYKISANEIVSPAARVFEKLFFWDVKNKKRQHPFYKEYPFVYCGKTKLIYPENYILKNAELLETRIEKKNIFIDFSYSAQIKNTTIQTEVNAAVKEYSGSAAEYNDFSDNIEFIKNSFDIKLIFNQIKPEK